MPVRSYLSSEAESNGPERRDRDILFVDNVAVRIQPRSVIQNRLEGFL